MIKENEDAVKTDKTYSQLLKNIKSSKDFIIHSLHT